MAPMSVVRLAEELISRVSTTRNFFIDDSICITVRHKLDHLEIEDYQLYVHVLGTYGQPAVAPNRTGKARFEKLYESWRVTTIAAEACMDWPRGFLRILEWLNANNDDGLTPKLSHRFGHLYRQLYTTLSDKKFDFVRFRFENFIDENWPTLIRRRNSRPRKGRYRYSLSTWITLTQAGQRANLPKSRIRQLVANGDVKGDSRLTPSGRCRVVVETISLDKYITGHRCNDNYDFNQTSELLGLTKSRLRRIFSLLFPNAEKGINLAWKVSASDVSVVRQLAKDAKYRESLFDDETLVSIDSALRYHRLTDQGLVWLLQGMQSNIVPKPTYFLGDGIGQWVIKREWVDQANRFADQRAAQRLQLSMTLPDLAKRWNVKQEVVYRLANDGAFKLESVASAIYRGRLASLDEVEKFENTYVAARDLAHHLATSSRWLMGQLAEANIEPAFGPCLNGCRQMFYRRSDALSQTIAKLARSLEQRPKSLPDCSATPQTSAMTQVLQ